MKLPFSNEEYKKKKESHEILVPGDLCYCTGPYNPLDGWMIVIEGNYMDLHSNMYPPNMIADKYQLNQYAGFSYHDDFKSDRDIMIVEEGAWYYRHNLIYIRHLSNTEFETIKTLAETREEVPKEIVDAIFTIKKKYLDKYIKQTDGLSRADFIDADEDTTIGMILSKLPTDMTLHIDNAGIASLQHYVNYKVNPNTLYVEETEKRKLLHVKITSEIRTNGPSYNNSKSKPKKIKLKKIESKVKKEEPKDPMVLYGPGDLVHLKDDETYATYIVIGSLAYLYSGLGTKFSSINNQIFHAYLIMKSDTDVYEWKPASELVMYEERFPKATLENYYNRFLEEKI